MPRAYLPIDTFQAAYDRFYGLYSNGHRVIVSCSGGKDSGICVELAVMAARDAGRLPIDIVMRDEEIMLPGTFEYCERLAQRTDEIDFHWVIAGQPIINIFNRFDPYFWVFDYQLPPEKWVRTPPGVLDAPPLPGRQPYYLDDGNIHGMTTIDRFPLKGLKGWDDWDDLTPKQRIRRTWTERENPDVAKLYSIIGLRTSESPRRMMGLMSSRGWVITTPGRWGAWDARPIYDWLDGDVWKAVNDFGWDYNHAYDVMYRMGIKRSRMRIAPPTLTTAGVEQLQMASRAWPRWFSKVADRLEGVRSAAQFGLRSVQPERRLHESWRQVIDREILEHPRVPDWIKDRTLYVIDYQEKMHRSHAPDGTFPDAANCPGCTFINSYKKIAQYMYNGDPFSMKVSYLPVVEPEVFREGAGVWGPGGSPNFA